MSNCRSVVADHGKPSQTIWVLCSPWRQPPLENAVYTAPPELGHAWNTELLTSDQVVNTQTSDCTTPTQDTNQPTTTTPHLIFKQQMSAGWKNARFYQIGLMVARRCHQIVPTTPNKWLKTKAQQEKHRMLLNNSNCDFCRNCVHKGSITLSKMIEMIEEMGFRGGCKLKGLCCWGCAASVTDETIKYDPRSAVWGINEWVWRLIRHQNSAHQFLMLWGGMYYSEKLLWRQSFYLSWPWLRDKQ